jgi:hypothetical protein
MTCKYLKLLAGAAGLEPATTGFGDRIGLYQTVPPSHVVSIFIGFLPSRDGVSYHRVTSRPAWFGSKFGSRLGPPLFRPPRLPRCTIDQSRDEGQVLVDDALGDSDGQDEVIGLLLDNAYVVEE